MCTNEIKGFGLWLEMAFIQVARKSYGFRFHLASEIHMVTDSPEGLAFNTSLSKKIYGLYKKGAYLGDELSPRRKKILQLKARDGEDCFYCGNKLGTDITVEHLLSKAHRGSNRLENLALAHNKCNSKAGSLSLAEKVELRDRLRKENAAKQEIESAPTFWGEFCLAYKINQKTKRPNLAGYRLFLEEVKAFAAVNDMGVTFNGDSLLVRDTEKFKEACTIFAKEARAW